MKLEKIRSISASHRRAVTARFEEFEVAKVAKEKPTFLKCSTIFEKHTGEIRDTEITRREDTKGNRAKRD